MECAHEILRGIRVESRRSEQFAELSCLGLEKVWAIESLRARPEPLGEEGVVDSGIPRDACVLHLGRNERPRGFRREQECEAPRFG
ncbi:hypothetical protein [Sinomonas notoginsengisoli]|uniref:hypothetical protein n=1 Tax=Sinomonas notoginsengisoli TaxID=1457311 RepID=UPI0027E02DB0|nr:hypothetical protein [Sinomonas notoginsengisoli]